MSQPPELDLEFGGIYPPPNWNWLGQFKHLHHYHTYDVSFTSPEKGDKNQLKKVDKPDAISMAQHVLAQHVFSLAGGAQDPAIQEMVQALQDLSVPDKVTEVKSEMVPDTTIQAIAKHLLLNKVEVSPVEIGKTDLLLSGLKFPKKILTGPIRARLSILVSQGLGTDVRINVSYVTALPHDNWFRFIAVYGPNTLSPDKVTQIVKYIDVSSHVVGGKSLKPSQFGVTDVEILNSVDAINAELKLNTGQESNVILSWLAGDQIVVTNLMPSSENSQTDYQDKGVIGLFSLLDGTPYTLAVKASASHWMHLLIKKGILPFTPINKGQEVIIAPAEAVGLTGDALPPITITVNDAMNEIASKSFGVKILVGVYPIPGSGGSTKFKAVSQLGELGVPPQEQYEAINAVPGDPWNPLATFEPMLVPKPAKKIDNTPKSRWVVPSLSGSTQKYALLQIQGKMDSGTLQFHGQIAVKIGAVMSTSQQAILVGDSVRSWGYSFYFVGDELLLKAIKYLQTNPVGDKYWVASLNAPESGSPTYVLVQARPVGPDQIKIQVPCKGFLSSNAGYGYQTVVTVSKDVVAVLKAIL